jgi:hypothetical protein
MQHKVKMLYSLFEEYNALDVTLCNSEAGCFSALKVEAIFRVEEHCLLWAICSSRAWDCL